MRISDWSSDVCSSDLETVNFRCDDIGGDAGDRSDLRPCHAFEIEEQYLAVGRVEAVDDRQDQVHRLAAFGGIEGGGGVVGEVDFVEAGPAGGVPAAMGNHVRGRAVVRDAPDPGAQRTAAIEPRETLPQRDLDILFAVRSEE